MGNKSSFTRELPPTAVAVVWSILNSIGASDTFVFLQASVHDVQVYNIIVSVYLQIWCFENDKWTRYCASGVYNFGSSLGGGNRDGRESKNSKNGIIATTILVTIFKRHVWKTTY